LQFRDELGYTPRRRLGNMIHTDSVRVEGSGQFVDYIEHVRMLNQKPHKLRITVHTGGNRDQSGGSVERWDGAQWQGVARIGGAAPEVDPQVGYTFNGQGDDFKARLFKTDRDRLIDLAEE